MQFAAEISKHLRSRIVLKKDLHHLPYCVTGHAGELLTPALLFMAVYIRKYGTLISSFTSTCEKWEQKSVAFSLYFFLN